MSVWVWAFIFLWFYIRLMLLLSYSFILGCLPCQTRSNGFINKDENRNYQHWTHKNRSTVFCVWCLCYLQMSTTILFCVFLFFRCAQRCVNYIFIADPHYPRDTYKQSVAQWKAMKSNRRVLQFFSLFKFKTQKTCKRFIVKKLYTIWDR